MKTALGAVCGLTLFASAYLGLSYLLLKGTEDLRPLVWLALFVVPSGLTLAALASGASGVSTRALLLLIGAAVAWLGVWSIQQTLSNSHFEGYALVLGAIGVLQGLLTVALVLARPWQNGRIAGQ